MHCILEICLGDNSQIKSHTFTHTHTQIHDGKYSEVMDKLVCGDFFTMYTYIKTSGSTL